MLEFTVRVGYTDRERKFFTFVTVLADTCSEAQLVAAQMVDAIRREAIHGYTFSTEITNIAA